MNQTFSDLADRLFQEKLSNPQPVTQNPESRSPVHVVYGGANLFNAGTIDKLGRIALASLETYAPNFVEFAGAMWLKGADILPKFTDLIEDLEFRLADNPEKVKTENYEAWFAWTIYNRVIEKLKREPIEDFRIDFEDGYGIRRDAEEDEHAMRASDELAKAFHQNNLSAFTGFRVKSFQTETYKRAVRTLDLFLTNFLEKTDGKLPENFVVTLPKIRQTAEVEVLCALLGEIEKENSLPENSIKIEIMIETPQAVLLLSELAEAGKKRLTSAHFGAFDYTASFGITADHQHLGHDACRFARQLMQINLAPLGIRLSDSVTTEMPVPVHRGENLSEKQRAENKRAVRLAWRKHFNNVTFSLINGFYQSWDLHPAQLAARYAAVYAFFLESADEQAARLKNFVGKATEAMLTGNQFDDAASAQGLLNFFIRAAQCGAMTEAEVQQKTDLSSAELKSASFVKIMELKK
ncbi:MAG TPA: aldolase/citrate lyase family protein [Pyrinomonadaceae bacterium]|nr:aldolase/citrate lyase family protein [Pyrinomonadaceae bacterium]